MSYTSNVPQGNQSISQTQPIINANFQALTSFGNGYAEISNQVAAPSFSGGNDGLYTLNYPTTMLNEMYIHKQVAGGGTAEIPFTASILSQGTYPPLINSDGFSYLPSGIILRWITIYGFTGLSIIDLTPLIPNFTIIFSVIMSPYSTSLTDDDFALRLVEIVDNTHIKIFVSNRTTVGAGTGSAKVLIIGM